MRGLSEAIDSLKFLRFMAAAAACTGQMLNVSEIAQDADINQAQARGWLGILETPGMIFYLHLTLNPIDIKKTASPGTEMTRVFALLDRASVPRGKGAVVCMRPELGALDRENYIVPVWMI